MNEIEKEQKKIYDDQTKAFMKDRKANAAEKIKPLDPLKAVAGGYVSEGSETTYEIRLRKGGGDKLMARNVPKSQVGAKLAALSKKHNVAVGEFEYFKTGDLKEQGVAEAEMADQHSKATKHLKRYDKLHALRKDTNESIDSVKHKVGDTVYATHPVKRYTTMTGKVTRVGKTLTTLTHKDGTTGTYPHSDVNKDYEVLHPNPYKKNESVDEERNVTIGTTAWVKHPTDSKKRLSGKVTSVGKTHISLQHKDGTKEMYLHKDVAVASAKNESVDESFEPGKTVYTSHTDKVLKGKIIEKDPDNKDQYRVQHKDGVHSVHQDHIHPQRKLAGYMHEDTKPMSFSQYVKEGVFDWKANKSELDWSDKKDKKTEKSAEGGTIHKAREGSRNAETGGKAAKKSVGRPAGEYGGYKIDKAKRDTPEAKAELSRKVMAAKKEGFAIRKDYKGAMTAAIKKRQEELWNEKK